MSSTVGRLVVSVLTNKRGSGVNYGDLVYIDTSNADAFTVGTTSAYTGLIGVCIEKNGIANNATGRIQTQGLCAQVNLNANGTLGHFVKSYTVAAQATDAGASRVVGAFGQILTGGTSTPDVLLFGFPDAASSSASAGTPALTLSTTNSAGAASTFVATDATVAVFDATVPAINGTAAAGAAGTAARRDHVHGNSAPGALLAVATLATGANYTTTSATQADVNASVAITFTAPASGNVIVKSWQIVSITNVNVNTFLGIREATTDVVAKYQSIQGQTATAQNLPVVFVAYITGISAGSHTYKLAFATNGGTFSVLNTAASNPIIMEVWAA